MKFNTLIRYKMTADIYDYRITQGGAVANETEYFFSRNVPCNAYVDGTGRIFLHVADPIRLGCRVNNIRDQQGNLMVGSMENNVGYGFEVTSVEPVMNVFKQRDALRYTLIRL